MATEKRKHPRVRKTLRLEFRKDRFFLFKGPPEAAEMVDVSRGGVRLNTRVSLKKGENVTLLVPLRTHSKGVQFGGRVMWMRRLFREGVGYTQIGVQFQPLSREQSMVVFSMATGASS
jgi:Tfp pilus assembly protein PilZ